MDLKPGEVLCSNCKGKGYIRYKIHRTSRKKLFTLCEKCRSIGKFDWIEAVVGKRFINEPWWPPAGIARGVIHELKTRGNYMPKM